MYKYYILILLLSISNILFSEESLSSDLPFVSSINVTKSKNIVSINWKMNDTDNYYKNIYRSNSRIDSKESLDKSHKIATIKDTGNTFTDSPPEGDYFYAITLQNPETEEEHKVFIPYRNYTMFPLKIQKEEIYSITSLSAENDYDKIILRWNYKSLEKNSNKPKNVIIYRNTTPIKNLDILTKSQSIGKFNISEKVVFDKILPNIRYFYAIFVENSDHDKFINGVNITLNPSVIHIKNNVFDSFNTNDFIPLPLLALTSDPKNGVLFKDEMILKSPIIVSVNNKTKKIINDDYRSHSSVKIKRDNIKNSDLKHLDLHILNDETIYKLPQHYETLYQTAMSSLENKQYYISVKQFEEIIFQDIPDNLYIRVAYYIGMSYYQLGRYYNAYLYFMLSFKELRRETLPYIESIHQQLYYNDIINE